jgi:hypothetical protein
MHPLEKLNAQTDRLGQEVDAIATSLEAFGKRLDVLEAPRSSVPLDGRPPRSDKRPPTAPCPHIRETSEA